MPYIYRLANHKTDLRLASGPTTSLRHRSSPSRNVLCDISAPLALACRSRQGSSTSFDLAVGLASGAVIVFEVTAAEFLPPRRTSASTPSTSAPGSTANLDVVTATKPTARCVKAFFTFNTAPVGLAFLPDTTSIAFVSSAGHVIAINMETGVRQTVQFTAAELPGASIQVISLAVQENTGVVVVAALVDGIARLLTCHAQRKCVDVVPQRLRLCGHL